MTSTVAVATALAIGGASLASSSRTDSGGNQHRQTIRLMEFQQSFVPEDGKETNRPGTTAVIHSLLKTSAGRNVGRMDFKCSELSPAPNGVYHCDGTDTFVDGSTIEFAGLGTFAQLDYTVSVTGGTGRYIGAGGQAFFHSLNSTGTKSLDTYTLTR
jgi:hypothetical protein